VLTGLNTKRKVNITSCLKRKERIMEYNKIMLRHAVDAMQYQSYRPLDEINLYDLNLDPEESYSKKEALFKLPKESFMILQLIYYAPSEILEQLTDCPGGKYKGRLTKYIQSHFNWKPGQIEKYILKLKAVL
jgi:hypothetical protein